MSTRLLEYSYTCLSLVVERNRTEVWKEIITCCCPLKPCNQSTMGQSTIDFSPHTKKKAKKATPRRRLLLDWRRPVLRPLLLLSAEKETSIKLQFLLLEDWGPSCCFLVSCQGQQVMVNSALFEGRTAFRFSTTTFTTATFKTKARPWRFSLFLTLKAQASLKNKVWYHWLFFCHGLL